jgi:hypothetical protein
LVGETVVGEAVGEAVVGEDVGALVGETVVGEAVGAVVDEGLSVRVTSATKTATSRSHGCMFSKLTVSDVVVTGIIS